MVTMMFPEVSVAYKSFIPAKSAITKSSLKYGQYMHRLYHLGEEGKEYSKIKGIRPDFVEVKTRTIYELKPNNPRAIKRGHKQLETYKKRFEQEYGGEWNTVLDLY